MKITNCGSIESGYGKAAWKAFNQGLDYQRAIKRWTTAKKNSLWIKAALKEFAKIGGHVPGITKRKK